MKHFTTLQKTFFKGLGAFVKVIHNNIFNYSCENTYSVSRKNPKFNFLSHFYEG